MTNENNMTEIDYDTTHAIRVALTLRVMDTWKIRKTAFFRNELKKNIRALRVMRNSRAIFQEKYIFAK